MELSNTVTQLLNDAVSYAINKGYEYITPEVFLLTVCDYIPFVEAYTACGGNINELKKMLSGYLREYVDIVDVETPEFSASFGQALTIAAQSAYNSGRSYIELTHVIHGILQLENSYAVYFMKKQKISEVDLLQNLISVEDNEEYFIEDGYEENEEHLDEIWKRYAPCLNETLTEVNPLIGREDELERTIQILCRKDKNNPLHIGEPGVGKTAITYGLVDLLRSGNIPEPLLGAKVYSLDLGGMLAGAQYRGEFENRIKKVLNEIEKEDKPIIYIDEIHNLLGAGATGDGSFDASNMLKPYLSNGHIRFIGATTFDEYKKYFEKSKSLTRRFQNIEISEPGIDETIAILEGLKSKYEKFHGVKYAKGVLEYAVKMSDKHINDRFLPDKAIDLMDEAGAYRKLHKLNKKTQTVGKDVINEILTKICRVPIETVNTEDLSNLATLEKRIKCQVFGQDEAINQVVNSVKFSKAGLLEQNKPLASLLFVGPTGVGKTEIAKILSKELGVKLIRFDMSEYGEKHSIAKLIGSPAGYVGYEEGGILTEAIRKSPSAVLLLDEIEKAHPDIYNILLQVMDYATLTDNQGRKADFRNVILIMTSNAGANKLGKSEIGFGTSKINVNAIMDAVKNTFQPEFRNRLNQIVVFNSMDNDMARKIVTKKLSELSDALSTKKIKFKVSKKATDLLITKGVSVEFGAREIDRVIRGEIKPLLVDEILLGKLKKGGICDLDAESDGFKVTFSK